MDAPQLTSRSHEDHGNLAGTNDYSSSSVAAPSEPTQMPIQTSHARQMRLCVEAYLYNSECTSTISSDEVHAEAYPILQPGDLPRLEPELESLVIVLQQYAPSFARQSQKLALCNHEAVEIYQKLHLKEDPHAQRADVKEQARNLSVHSHTLRVRAENAKTRSKDACSLANLADVSTDDLEGKIREAATEQSRLEANLLELEQKLDWLKRSIARRMDTSGPEIE